MKRPVVPPTVSAAQGQRVGIRLGVDLLYWLQLRLRRRKARGPAAGTPRCGRRWRAVLAHPAAPTLLTTSRGAPVLPPTDGSTTAISGSPSSAMTRAPTHNCHPSSEGLQPHSHVCMTSPDG